MLDHSKKRRPSAWKVEASSPISDSGSSGSSAQIAPSPRGVRKHAWGYYVFRQGSRTLLKPEHCQHLWLNGIRDAVVPPSGQPRAM